MTDEKDTETTEDEDRNDRSISSRRRFLGTALATPALLGLAVGTYEASHRYGRVGDNRPVKGVIRGIAADQTDFIDRPTALSADPRLIASLDLRAGQQLRVRRSDDEYAVYTLVEKRPERQFNRIRMSASAQCRLDLGSRSFDGWNPETCPAPLRNCSIKTRAFTGKLEATVPNPDLSPEEARERDEFVEDLDDRGSSIAVLAPHGGAIEPKTDEQAALVGELAGATTWRAMGWRSGGGSYHRWRIPSDEIHPASFPALEKIADRQFDVAVTFNGGCHSGIHVGGRADDSLRQRVIDSINEALPACATSAQPADAAYAGRNDSLLANRLAENGITVTQGYTERQKYASEIATGVAGALDDDVEIEQPDGC